MADISLQHSALSEAETSMGSAGNQMDSQMSDFMAQLQRYAASFEGQTKDAWTQMQNTVDTKTNEAHQAYAQAGQALGQIHQMLTDADNKGAAQFG